MDSQLVGTPESLAAFLDSLSGLQGPPPSLFVDLEGDNLSRHGTISIMTILLEPQDRVYLVDVTRLKSAAFSTAGADGRTLQNVLESNEFIKVFFDIRNDSDALFSLYGVRVGGIEDLQLMELAARTGTKKCVNGLSRCIEHDSGLDWAARSKWQRVKDDGRKLFDPARGGSYSVFDNRPLSAAMVEYCCQDVALMPKLRERYRARLCDAWWEKIQQETAARIQLSQGVSYNGKGRHMAEAPRGWIHWQPTSNQRISRRLVGPEPARDRIAGIPSSFPASSIVDAHGDADVHAAPKTGDRPAALNALVH